MGGDTQPQIVLQVLARLLVHGHAPGRAVGEARWALGSSGGFQTWEGDGPGFLAIEAHAAPEWDEGLAARGHEVRRSLHAIDHAFGHTQVIEATDGVPSGVADPRALDGAAAGY
jgi:gamma-glutamyltranspeptidase / glutathione hydrolase